MNGASSSKRKRKRGGRPKSNYWNEVEKIGDMWKQADLANQVLSF